MFALSLECFKQLMFNMLQPRFFWL